MPWRLQRSPWERNQTLNWDGMNSSIPSPSLLDWEDLFPRAGTHARTYGFVCLLVSGVPLNYSFSLFFSDPRSSLFVFLERGPHSLVDSPVGCGKVAFQVQKREKERCVVHRFGSARELVFPYAFSAINYFFFEGSSRAP